jgi:uncharacterized protein involved in exopolysaccharide biosynthesis
MNSSNSVVSQVDVTPSSQIEVMEYYHLAMMHKWLIITCTAVGITLALWYNFHVQPVYRAAALLAMSNSQAKSPLTGEALGYDTVVSQTLAFQTHAKLITSHPVLKQVVRELKLDQVHPLQQAEPGPFRKFIYNVDLLLGQTPASPPSDKDNMDSLVNELRGKIHAAEVRNTLLMTVSAEDRDPVMAQEIANAVAKTYIQYDISSHLKSSQNSTTWMSDQLFDVKKKLDDAEQEFMAYKQNEQLFSMKGRQEQISKNIDEFNSAYIQAKNKRLELNTKLQELQRTTGPNGNVKDVRALVDNPIINDLYRQRMDAEVELSKLSSIYKPKHPKIVQITTQIDKINKKLKEELNKEVSNLNTEKTMMDVKEKALQNTVSGFEEDALTTNKKALKYSILERNVEMYRQMYDTLLSRLKQTSIVSTAETSDLRIAENATLPTGPISPRKTQNLIIGLVLGLIAGVGITYFQNYFDRSIRTEEDVQRYFGLPVLSVIPVAEGTVKKG